MPFSIRLKRLGRPNLRIQHIQSTLHAFLRDLLSKFGEQTSKVDIGLFFHLLSNKTFQHRRQRFFPWFPNTRKQTRDSLVNQCRFVQLNLKILFPFEVLRKTPHQPIYKTIDGHHAEVLIVMHHRFRQRPCPPLQRGSVNGHHLQQGFTHASLSLSDFAYVFQDAVLHFLGRLVGKGDGQDVLEKMRLIFPQ